MMPLTRGAGNSNQPMIQIDMKSVVFFDSSKVLRAVKRVERQKLSRFGAYVRQRAKTSIRPGRGISTPGSPPVRHTGLLGKLILFGYNEAEKSVVIGPVQFRIGSLVPRLLEHGGRARNGAVYRARPFMVPAFEAEKPGFLNDWRDSVHG